MKKRKRMDKFEYQALREALRDIVKEDGGNITEMFEIFKQMKVEGNRKGVPSVMYSEYNTDHLLEIYYTESEFETMYMGTESKIRKIYPRKGSYQRRQFFDRWQRSTTRGISP